MGMNFTTAKWQFDGAPSNILGTGNPAQSATATVSTDPTEVWAIGYGQPVAVKAMGRTEVTLEIAMPQTGLNDLTYNDFNTKFGVKVWGGGQVVNCSGYLNGSTYNYPANDLCTVSYTITGRGSISADTDTGMSYTPPLDVLFGDEVTGVGGNVLSKTVTYTPEVTDLNVLGTDMPVRTLMYVTKDVALEYASCSGIAITDHQSFSDISSYDLEGAINVSVGNANSITVTSRTILYA